MTPHHSPFFPTKRIWQPCNKIHKWDFWRKKSILTHTHCFFKRKPQKWSKCIGLEAPRRPPPSLALRSERFSGDTAVSFSQALLELGHGLTGRGRAESEEREKEKRRVRKLKDKQRTGSRRNLFTCMLLRAPPHPDNTQIDKEQTSTSSGPHKQGRRSQKAAMVRLRRDRWRFAFNHSINV